MTKYLWAIAFIILLVAIILALLVIRGFQKERARAATGGHYPAGEDEDGEYGDEYGGGDGDYVEGGGISIRMREPWYQAVVDGKKTVEARLDRAPFNKLKDGAAITIARSRPQGDTTEYPGARRVKATVTRVKKYPGLNELLEGETLGDLLPGAKTKAAGLKTFREFITEEAEKEHGVLAVGFKLAK